MRRWIATGIVVFAASAACAADQEGLILGFAQSGSGLRLDAISTSERIVAPRSAAGVQWRIAATSTSGHEIWSRPFPAPRAFHAPRGHEPGFSIAVPHVESGARLAVLDESGMLLWSQAVDTELLERARESAKTIRREVDLAYSATAMLQRESAKRAEEQRSGHQSQDTSRQPPSQYPQWQQLQLPSSDQSTPVAAKGAGQTYHVGGSATVNNYDVRVYDADTGAFVVSRRANWTNSRFDFQLPRGRYEFEIDDNHLYLDNPFFYRAPSRTEPIYIAGDTEVPPIVPNDDAGWLEFIAELPCSLALLEPLYDWSVPVSLAVQLQTASGMRLYRNYPAQFERMEIALPAPTSTGEYCAVSYRIQVTPGDYAFEMSFPGWQPLQTDEVSISSGGTTTITHRFPMADRTLVWRGKISDANGQPLTNYRLVVADRINDAVHWHYSGYETNGDFDIPYSPGWTIEFVPTYLSTGNVRQRFAMNGSPLPTTVILDEFADENIPDAGLMRIHGDGQRENHYNILFLAEGYTEAEEAFTDTNANGTWDGFYWMDRNGDGTFNDYHRPMGSPDYALLETDDPLSGNEPFDDSNGDGIVNHGEAGEFELNARDFMRSLLASDFWNKHAHAFNAYLLYEPSLQAGFDITQEDGSRTLERDTRYGANLVLPRALMQLDRASAMQKALSVLPEVDMVIVLVNQPVHLFARGNVTLSQPGSMVWPAGLGQRWNTESGPSHEMAHYVASLCDEYAEYDGVNPSHGQADTWCPNVSYVPDPTRVPWAHWLSGDAQAPNTGIDGSLGVFEGADYYYGGAYRPTYNSTMRNNSPLFNAPSRAALERAMYERTGDPAVLQTRPRPPAHSRIRKPHPL